MILDAHETEAVLKNDQKVAKMIKSKRAISYLLVIIDGRLNL